MIRKSPLTYFIAVQAMAIVVFWIAAPHIVKHPCQGVVETYLPYFIHNAQECSSLSFGIATYYAFTIVSIAVTFKFLMRNYSKPRIAARAIFYVINFICLLVFWMWLIGDGGARMGALNTFGDHQFVNTGLTIIACFSLSYMSIVLFVRNSGAVPADARAVPIDPMMRVGTIEAGKKQT